MRVAASALPCLAIGLLALTSVSAQVNELQESQFKTIVKNNSQASTTITVDIENDAYEQVGQTNPDTRHHQAVRVTGFLDIKRPYRHGGKAHLNYTCTGVLVDHKHVLTAYHCLQPSDKPRATAMRYTANKDFRAQNERFVTVDLSVESPVEFHKDEDWVLLQVVSEQEEKLRGWPIARLSRQPPRPRDRFSLVHHPLGYFKMLSTQNCVGAQVGSTFEPDLKGGFAHSCFTRGGSSGAPIFDEQLRVIGIHTGEFEQGLNRGISIRTIIQGSSVLASLADHVERAPRVDGRVKGAVQIWSYPDRARILVNGRFEGLTPKTLQLPHGRHEIAVQLRGYEDCRDVIEVPRKTTLVCELTNR